MQNLEPGEGGENEKFLNLGGQWYEGVKAVNINIPKVYLAPLMQPW